MSTKNFHSKPKRRILYDTEEDNNSSGKTLDAISMKPQSEKIIQSCKLTKKKSQAKSAY